MLSALGTVNDIYILMLTITNINGVDKMTKKLIGEITRFMINAGEASGDVVSFIWACDKNNNSRHLLSSNEQAELMSYSEKNIEFAVNFLNKQIGGKKSRI